MSKITNVHRHSHILSYSHESGMSQHQRKIYFGCHFQRIEHHKELQEKVSPNSQSTTVSHWLWVIQLKLTI